MLRMDRNRDKMAEKILHLTLEILFQLTGEDYTVVKKTSSERCQASGSEGLGRNLSLITGSHPLVHEGINDQKILELTYKMIELLTGEVPVRCQDVTVHLSTEEWKYLEGHKNLYKDVMMEVPEPHTSPVPSSKRTTPEKCPRPFLLQDCSEENRNDLQDHQVDGEGKDLTHINTTETYVRGDEWCKEEIPTDNSTVLSSKRRTPKRCPRPLLSQACSEENPSVSQDHQGKELTHINTTETYVRGDEWCKEEIPTDNSTVLSSKRTTPKRCPRPPLPQACAEKSPRSPQDHQVFTISDPLRGDLLYKRIFLIDPTRMDRDRMAERILHLSLEILFRLTGEDYTVVKKTSSERCRAPVSEGWGRPLSKIMGPPSYPLVHEDINDQKILELTYKMIELLTGEVPIRCQDVTVYFSMEEWEYLKGHKDLYKDVMMEVPQPLISPVQSSKRTIAERCPRPFLPQDCKQDNFIVPQDHQGVDMTHINTTETYVRGDEWCKEEIPTDNHPGGCIRSLEGHEMYFDFKTEDHDFTEGTYEEHTINPALPSAFDSKDLSTEPIEYVLSSDSSQTVKQNKNRAHPGKKRYLCSECGKCFNQKSHLVTHQKIHTGEKPFLCPECGKCFVGKSQLAQHWKTHTGEKPFSCSECGRSFTVKANLARHERIHTGEKPFSCLECGRCFTIKASLVKHQIIHTDVKPFSCSECGKCFKQKSDLVTHQRLHTGEKPYSCTECEKSYSVKLNLVKHKQIHTVEKPFLCSECGKGFTCKANLVTHQIIHTGEKPFSCSECGRGFTVKSNLITHQRIHTGQKPFSCSDCGKCYRFKPNLITHQRIHTGEKPFSCSECGKCFRYKSNLVTHQKIHTGQKSFSCQECGKCFTHKSYLVTHQGTHTGEKPYSCSECGKCFTRTSSLVDHQKTHRGEKPYSCSECGKCFVHKKYLLKHHKTHKGK
ncbi:uncharacterized protein [Phyllobates terribilis]|uniref:uncharacterized protein n=1 Tax=Phyllobates terribilis TaxID=111132 RepID=UPI003CCB5580